MILNKCIYTGFHQNLDKLHITVINLIDFCMCHVRFFFRFFSKGHSPLNLKQNYHRKVTITHTFVYAVRNMQVLLLMTFGNSYLLLLTWKLNKQTVTTTLFINLSTADNVLLNNLVKIREKKSIFSCMLNLVWNNNILKWMLSNRPL